MIHLISGESAAMTLRQTTIPGDKFSLDDILMEGPIVDGLQSDASWEFRAGYLERDFAFPKSDYLAAKQTRDGLLNNSLEHDEIVLWFEFDLFCQANLLYFLDWYASRDLRQTRLTLICPETFPGRAKFRGLGELFAPELESLFPTRAEVTSDQKRAARRAWQAFSSKDPEDIETFQVGADVQHLPLLAPALRAHLQRFPSSHNGLGILAQKTLEILNAGPLPFHTLFTRVVDNPEIFRHGMGDLQLQAHIDRWSSAPTPLVEETAEVSITPAGQTVLENRADAIALNGIDWWFGGVHLTPENLWRWDEAKQRVVQSGPSLGA